MCYSSLYTTLKLGIPSRTFVTLLITRRMALLLWIHILCAVKRHPKPKLVDVLFYLALTLFLGAVKDVIVHMVFVTVKKFRLPPLFFLQVLYLTDLQGVVVVLVPAEGLVSGKSLFEAGFKIVPAHYKFILLLLS
jgi:hypothetical protein